MAIISTMFSTWTTAGIDSDNINLFLCRHCRCTWGDTSRSRFVKNTVTISGMWDVFKTGRDAVRMACKLKQRFCVQTEPIFRDVKLLRRLVTSPHFNWSNIETRGVLPVPKELNICYLTLPFYWPMGQFKSRKNSNWSCSVLNGSNLPVVWCRQVAFFGNIGCRRLKCTRV